MEDDYLWALAGICIGVLITMTMISIFNPLIISQQTGDEICQHLDNTTIKASVYDSKLVCYTPSYDSSSNIIIKQMKGGERDE